MAEEMATEKIWAVEMHRASLADVALTGLLVVQSMASQMFSTRETFAAVGPVADVGLHEGPLSVGRKADTKET